MNKVTAFFTHPLRGRREAGLFRKFQSLLFITSILCTVTLFTPLNSDTHAATTCTPTFRGIYQFTGTPAVNNPYIVGGELHYYWSQIETSEGVYDWSRVDNDMAQWTAQNKKVILRISAAGLNWSSAAAHATPQWVLDMGVPTVTEADGSVLPQYWNPIFLSKYQDFIQAFAARYDGNPNITYIEMGIGSGGETLADTYLSNNRLTLWQSIGYTDQTWWSTIQQIIGFYQTSFHTTPLAPMIDSTFLGGTRGYNRDLVVNYAASQGLWTQYNGLSNTTTLTNPNWFATSNSEEQRDSALNSGDTLQSDLQTIINMKAQYALIYGSDINNSANASALAWAASQVCPA